jgi:hypothetical protein
MNNSPKTNPRSFHLPRGRVLGRTAAVLAIATAALPGAALAATPKQHTFKYNVPVKRMALASGSTVAVNGTVTSPQANVKDWWSANTIKSTVQKGVNNGRQIPYSANGFRCVPVIKGARTNFSIIYRGDTASG